MMEHTNIQYYIIPDGGKFQQCELYEHRFSGVQRYGGEWEKIIAKNPFVYAESTFDHVDTHQHTHIV